MSVVRFDQIARECRETFKGSFEGKPIVGLEHIEPYDMLLKNYDVDVETTFTKSFKKGQILFGRRRAYQHKACVATIDGICSGDITVIEPIEGKVYPDLLPFIIQNDDFFEHAIKGSNGALSPRVKWEHMANFEFDLPSLAEQKVLAEKLWAAYEVKQSYLKMIEATQEMVKSQFIEMFENQTECPKDLLKEHVKEMFIGPFGSALKNECFVEDDTRFCVVYEQKHAIDKDITIPFRYVNEDKYNELKRFTITPGDIIVSCRGTVGEVFLIPQNAPIGIMHPSIMKIRLNEGYMPEFFIYALTKYMKERERLNIGTGIKMAIKATELENEYFPVPTLEAQRCFVDIVHQADKSISELRKSVDAIDKVIKSLINENL